MDGENNGSGKPYEQMNDLGGNFKPLFLGWHPYGYTPEVYHSPWK